MRGRAAYSGQSVLDQFSSNADSQETLTTLAGDTGGKAFLDSNDLSGVFTAVQRDTSAYYVIGYRSSNPEMNGKFRRVKVVLNRPDLKLEYRKGYFGPKDYAHFNKEDREQQMLDELASELPEIDVAVYMAAAYFRMDDAHYYIPVSIVIPGSQIPFVTEKDKDRATIEREFFATARPSSIIKRFASIDEVAAMIAYTCSTLASATTGAALRVDGGVISWWSTNRAKCATRTFNTTRASCSLQGSSTLSL